MTPAQARLHTWYLSGAMSGVKDLNFPLFHATAAALRARGLTVVNPAEVCPDKEMPWAECMDRDLVAMETCTAIALLPGWQDSRGANREYGFALGRQFEVAMAEDLV